MDLPGWGNVLYGDSSDPYSDNADTEIVTPTVDLSASSGKPTILDFYTYCDNEYNTGALADYMSLEYSSD